ncbi:MAG: DUF3592 domain-containing protein [Akkermansiaceae bacterium]|nr:DUF3592 domain-containing protein [Akkermansiaceae bacterium]
MSSKNTGGLAGKFFVCMIGFMLVLIAVLFQWLMLRSYLNAKSTREWTQAEAVVMRSSIEERHISGSPPEARLFIRYQYSYDDEEYVSGNMSSRGSKWSRERAAVTALLADYPAGSSHQAWINPEDPHMAILKHDTKAAGYTLWFPAVIMIGGCGIIWGAVRDKSR